MAWARLPGSPLLATVITTEGSEYFLCAGGWALAAPMTRSMTRRSDAQRPEDRIGL
jgi:hypothetical protein